MTDTKFKSKKNETTINEYLRRIKAKIGMDRNSICLLSTKLVLDLLDHNQLEYDVKTNNFYIPDLHGAISKKK